MCVTVWVLRYKNKKNGDRGTIVFNATLRVHRCESEMPNLRRQVERGSVPLPSQNQQAGADRFPIPIYSGERSTLSRFLKLFYTWTLSHKSEYALSHSRPVTMTTKKSRAELELEYGRRNVEQSLVVWSALTKAVEKTRRYCRHRCRSQSSVRGLEDSEQYGRGRQ